MKPGPLRQLMGAAGLVGLAPTAALLAQGALSPAAAAVRAVVTLATVMVIGRVVASWLHATARGLERRAPAERDGDGSDTPSRRHDHRPAPAGAPRSAVGGSTPENA